MEQKREINSLRKLDQEENLKRRQDFDRLIREKLALEVSDKIKRADLIVEDRNKLREIAFDQRARLKGFKVK